MATKIYNYTMTVGTAAITEKKKEREREKIRAGLLFRCSRFRTILCLAINESPSQGSFFSSINSKQTQLRHVTD